MPITIKTGTLKYKKSDGTYNGFNAIAQESTDQQLADIHAAGTAEVGAVTAKGEEVLESIPEDYTELSGDVDELKSQMDDMGTPPDTLNSDAENVDLDITDEDGNVIVRFANGHIQTKEFDSSSIEAEGDTYINPTDAESVDLDVSDIQGNVLLRLKDGHIKTKKFDSTEFVPDNSNPLSIIKNTFDYAGCFLHVGCIGDSLASGAASSNDGGTVVIHDFKDQSWGQYLARMTRNKYYNFSQGGLTTKSWLASTYATQAFDGEHDCEAYIIGLGENDYSQGLPIGTSADIDLSDYTQNADTFYGNYGGIIQRIQEHEPKAKIFVIVNPRSYLETSGYNAAIRAMATIFGNVYVIDLYTYGDIVANGSFLRKQERNGHFNALGYKYCAKVIGTYIDWIIANNLTEFKTIELIGTEWSYT